MKNFNALNMPKILGMLLAVNKYSNYSLIIDSITMRVLFLTILVVILHQKCNSANILAIAPFGGKSHFDIMQSLLKALVSRGHEVDVVSHFPLKTPIPRYELISRSFSNFSVAD